MAKPSNEYLEEERKKIWTRLIYAEDVLEKLGLEVAKGANDYSSEAKQASKMATEYKNRSEASKNSISQYAIDAQDKLDNINQIQTSIKSLSDQITNDANEAKKNNNDTQLIASSIEAREVSIEENIEKLETIFEDFDNLTDNLSKLKEVLSNSDETATKIEVLHNSLLSKKKEVDQLYYEIFGYTDKQNGVDIEIEGIKDKLKKTYDDLSQQVTTAVNNINQIKTKTENDYGNILKDSKENYDKHILNWDLKYFGLEQKIAALLPNALTAGLSSAYSEKKEVELKEYKRLK